MKHRHTEEELVGKTFGELTVLKEVEKDKHNRTRFECVCSCGNSVIYKGTLIATGRRTDCGHGGKKRVIDKNKSKKGQNNYIVSDDYVIGITTNTKEEFYIDKEDLEKIKGYTWIDHRGYIESSYKDDITKKKVALYLHREVLSLPSYKETKIEVDHINKNKHDNRKSNLRETIHSENCKNTTLQKKSRTGFIGVNINNNKFYAVIRCGKNRYKLGSFNNIEDALVARLKAEKELFGEFAPQKHLFEKYGI